MADAKLLRDIQIKTGIVKRYVKEYHYYEKEAQKQLEKINKMKSNAEVDEYTIKKANEILQENRAMLPIAANNVKKSSTELQNLLDVNVDSLKDTVHFNAAQHEISLALNIN